MHEEEVKLGVLRCRGARHERDANLLRSLKLVSGFRNLPRIPVFQEGLFALFQHFGNVTASMVVQPVETLVLADFVQEIEKICWAFGRAMRTWFGILRLVDIVMEGTVEACAKRKCFDSDGRRLEFVCVAEMYERMRDYSVVSDVRTGWRGRLASRDQTIDQRLLAIEQEIIKQILQVVFPTYELIFKEVNKRSLVPVVHQQPAPTYPSRPTMMSPPTLFSPNIPASPVL